MMTNVVMLGTAGSAPTKDRRMPSVAVVYGGDVLLFDCGEGTQFQMLQYGINPVKVRAMFISHMHGDHTIGIAGLIRTMALQNRKEPLYIYVPKGEEAPVRSLIIFDRAMINYPIEIKGVRAGKVYEGKGYSVSAFKLAHTVPTYGYVFKEDDRLRFRKELAHKLGVRGTMFGELQSKGSLVTGGRKVTLKELAWTQQGKKIVYATDTRPVRETLGAAKDADLLIHESSYVSSEQRLAERRKHSTAGEAAMLAKRAGVKMLVLTHISARHRSDTQMLSDARKFFRNTVVARDGYSLVI